MLETLQEQNMNFKHLLLSATATALLGISSPALAHHDGHDDDHPHAMHEHKAQAGLISQAQARKAALARIGGRVTDIDLDQDDGRPHYDIEIVKNGQEYKVVVDARTGRVISSRRDD